MRQSIAFALIATLLLCASVGADNRPDTSAVAIHPGPISADELAELMGIYVWKLNVSVPRDSAMVNLSLQQTNKGQSPSQLGAAVSCRMSAAGGNDVLIAITPLGGGISDAAQIRVTIAALGAIASSTVDNPLRRTLGFAKPQNPEVAGDGVFNLIGGYSGSMVQPSVSSADTVIALKIEAK
jgi:hypothetical protein